MERKTEMMTGIDRVYCNVAMDAILRANFLVGEATVEELLRPTKYGKGDTLGLDALPEIVMEDRISRFDPNLVFLTEEIGRTRKINFPQNISLQPVVFISDPTDRSSFFKQFLDSIPGLGKHKLKDIAAQSEMIELWEEQADEPALTSAPTCSISGIKRGVPFFSIIINYLTQDLFVSCGLGSKRLNIRGFRQEELTLKTVLEQGEEILFGFKRHWEDFDDHKRFFSFMGKTGYKENLDSAEIFLSDADEFLVYGEPGGPIRILFLSSLYGENPVGFVLANGEKISEWIHWLSYTAVSQSALRIFEISFERPWTKEGILMATSPAYSIFVFNEEKGYHLLDLAKINDYPNPSRYRATLLVTFEENQWAISTMQRHEYRELKFSL